MSILLDDAHVRCHDRVESLLEQRLPHRPPRHEKAAARGHLARPVDREQVEIDDVGAAIERERRRYAHEKETVTLFDREIGEDRQSRPEGRIEAAILMRRAVVAEIAREAGWQLGKSGERARDA